MKPYMKIGERGYYNGKRYRCVPMPAEWNCTHCDLNVYSKTSKSICARVNCLPDERRDGTNVMFVLQPKYRKEEKGGEEMTYEDRKNIMSDAVIDMIHASNLLDRLFSVEQSEYLDQCSFTAIKTSKGKLDCAITWLVNASKWEKEVHEEWREEAINE